MSFTNETDKQKYYIEKCRELIAAKEQKLGRKLTACVVTFGCQMNFKDSEKLMGILSQIGYQETDDEHADLVLYNTCTVRENANLKIYGRLGYLSKIKEKNPEMIIGLCGCMMQEPQVVEKLNKSYRFVDIIFGTHNVFQLAELLYDRLIGGHRIEDFCVKDSLVYILSRAQRRILVYDWKATFVDKIDLDDWYQHFEIVDDKLMFLSSENSNEKQYDFVVFNYAKSEDMNMFSPFENNEGITFKNFTPFSGTFNGGYYVLRPFDYTVYRLSRTEFEPYCLFEFNTKEQIEQGAALVDLYDKTSNKNVVQYLGSYEEYNGSIYLTFTLFEEKHGIGTYVYKVESDGKNLLMKIYENFSDKYPYISAPYGVYDGAFYSIRPALDILNIEEMYGLSLFHDKGLTEESNHVVFFHKLK